MCSWSQKSIKNTTREKDGKIYLEHKEYLVANSERELKFIFLWPPKHMTSLTPKSEDWPFQRKKKKKQKKIEGFEELLLNVSN